MKRSSLNTRFLIRAVLAFLVLAAATHVLHTWQMGRHAHGQLARADEAERAGEVEDSAAALARYLIFRPNDDAVRTRYGLLLASQARTNPARQRALQVLRAALPREGGALEVRLKAVDLALAVDEPAEACRLLEPAVAQYPDRADLHRRLAGAQLAAGRPRDAVDSLERLLTLAPAAADDAVRLAGLYRASLNQPERARLVLDRLVQRNPRLPRAYLVRARSLEAENQLVPAGVDLAVALRLAPGDPDVLAASAAFLHRRGQYAAARARWRQALEARPNRTDLVVGLARVERDAGRPADAVAGVRSALSRRPGDVDLRCALADLLLDQGKPDEADKFVRALPAAAGPRKRYLEGRLALARRQYQEAMTALVQADRDAGLDDDTRCGLLLALMRLCAEAGTRDDLLSTARRATLLADTPARRVEVARVLVGAGRSVEALPGLRKLVELPAPPDAVWNLLAQALLEEPGESPGWRRHRQEVQRLLARAERLPAEAATAALLRADLLLLNDERDEAWSVLAQARQQYPDEPALWRAQAALAAGRGDEKSAGALLAEADQRFASRLDYLIERSRQLAGQRGTQAVKALEALEGKATGLSAEQRDRLRRHLLELHAELGHTKGVERLAALLLEAHPRQLRPRLLLLEMRLAQGDEAGVQRVLAELRQVEGPAGLEYRCARAAWLLHRAARGERGGLDEARRLLDEARQGHPGAGRPWLLLGRLSDLEGRPGQALAHYQKGLALGDYQAAAVRRTVALLLEAGRHDDADRLLEQAEQRALLTSDLWRPAAEVALRAGKSERACRLARQAVAASRQTHTDLLWLAHVLETAGRRAEAGEVYEAAVRRAPAVADTWLARLAYHVRQNRLDGLEVCLAGMRESLDAARLSLAEARAHELAGQGDEAERRYRDILAGDGHDAQALSRLADLYLRTDRWDRAEPLLLVLLGPRVLPEEERPEVRRRLALVLVRPSQKQDRSALALAVLEQNRAVEGDTSANRRTAGLVRATRPAERAEALRALEQLPAVRPEERLALARAQEAAGKPAQALVQYQALVAGEPRNTTWLVRLVEAQLRGGNKVEAARWLQELEKREPRSERTLRLREQMRPKRGKG
jgi:predicted Zn-dependent protease